MIVLSIHDGHDAGACLVRDGKLVLHSSEERRVNKKNVNGVPRESVKAIFERTGIHPTDVDLVTVCGIIRNVTPITATDKHRLRYTVMGMLVLLASSQWATRLGRAILPKIRRRKAILEFLAEMGLGDTRVEHVDHHLCHAACAYYHRPWEGDTLVLTHDGAGDGLCATVSVGSGHDLRVIAQTPKHHSVANMMYSGVTEHLGLKPWEHEYKVMGMAPYGRAEYCAPILRKLFSVEGLHFRNHAFRTMNGMRKLYRNRLQGQRFDNLSAGCQLVFEELMLKWVRNAVEATGQHRVCGAGGAFLNVKANRLIRESDEVEALFAYPASDDGGVPVGGAILGYVMLCKEQGVEPALDLPQDMYLGLDFDEAAMAAALEKSGHPHQRIDDPAQTIGARLAAGEIIARFAGREEVGPRSLGNRCIMADPRDMGVIRKLNFAIKKRDFWMPFAASILEEDKDRYIKDCSDWAFWMIDAFETNPVAERDLIAGLHPMDLTVRPQIVNELNPSYGDIIRAFKERTGVGAILNTSFNLHGFPIVGTPEIALDTLDNSALDALQLGPFLVERKDRPATTRTGELETAKAGA